MINNDFDCRDKKASNTRALSLAQATGLGSVGLPNRPLLLIYPELLHFLERGFWSGITFAPLIKRRDKNKAAAMPKPLWPCVFWVSVMIAEYDVFLAGTATLTFATTAASSSSLAKPARPRDRCYAVGSTFLAIGLLFSIRIPRRGSGWQSRIGFLVVLLALVSGLVACGGGGGSGGGSSRGGGNGNPGTTPGAYTVTVTGTSGSTVATGTLILTDQ